ncbi:hypothetical protein CGZ93_04900 [Enemella dayhoffiae]|uniref:Uncharacterized protein n=1 Tax=Enemella dayhoffiae TaxID=2016507 RepID=A0A255H987_9ACTN|nr:hypothetical protein CGZ93_04900 [Enemella dayhoffiae]
MRPNRSRSPHRPEIHGLRGFAIALVVIYHIWGSGRVSGGVDVFLMISAYLLTGSLLRRGRSFSYLDHLLRRFRRLVPSAALVIVATLLGGWLLLPPTRWWDLLAQAEASLFYLQNWFLIAVATDYTAGNHECGPPWPRCWAGSGWSRWWSAVWWSGGRRFPGRPRCDRCWRPAWSCWRGQRPRAGRRRPCSAPAGGYAPGDTRVSNDWPPPLDPCGPDITDRVPLSQCGQIRSEQPTRRVAVVGDSHAAQWNTVLIEMAREHRWDLLVVGRPRCRIGVQADFIDADCRLYNEQVSRWVLEERPDVVFTVGSRAQPDGPELESETLDAAVEPWLEAGLPVLLIRDNPRWAFNMPECVQRHGTAACATPVWEKLGPAYPITDRARDAGVRLMDLIPSICPGGECAGVIGGVYVYMDDNHLTRAYTQTMRERFEEQWNDALGW